jgi:ketosteroid isomerase-like protein
MSNENVEVLRRAAELSKANDLKAVAEIYHPDAEVRDLQPAPGTPEMYRGHTAIVAVLEQWSEVFGDFTIEVDQYIDAHPWVVCAMCWRSTGKGSEASVEWRTVDAHEVKDGKVVRSIYNFSDVATALEAVRAQE